MANFTTKLRIGRQMRRVAKEAKMDIDCPSIMLGLVDDSEFALAWRRRGAIPAISRDA